MCHTLSPGPPHYEADPKDLSLAYDYSFNEAKRALFDLVMRTFTNMSVPVGLNSGLPVTSSNPEVPAIASLSLERSCIDSLDSVCKDIYGIMACAAWGIGFSQTSSCSVYNFGRVI